MLAFVSRLGRRLARPEAIGWPTFWISAFVYFSTTILFDARRFGGPLWLWLVGTAVGQIAIVAWALGFKYLLVRHVNSNTSRLILNLSIGASAGVVRALVLGFYSVQTGLANTPQWGFRIPAGAIAGFVLLVAGAGLMGAALEHRTALSELKQTQQQLLATRRNAPKLLDKARSDIGEQILKTLTPRFEELARMLKRLKSASGPIHELAEEISGVINTEVRPMSSSLAQRIDQSLLVPKKTPERQARRLGLPKEINLAESLSPLVTFQIALMLCIAFFATLTDSVTTMLGVLGAFVLLAMLMVASRLLRNVKTLSLGLGTAILAAIGAVSTLPISLLTQTQLAHSKSMAAMPLNAAFIIGVLVVGIGYTKMVDLERAKFEDEMMAFNDELQRELSWIDAQLWVIRRDWSYLLHGNVQSALTAAVARLTSTATVNEDTLRLVKQDIQRAQKALGAGIGHPFDLSAALDELRASWEGLCEVDSTISTAAEQVLSSDVGLGRAVNEILREAVGNAVRHGNATNVSINLGCTPTALELEVANNGSPVVNDYSKSIGSQMMDELSLGWLLNSPSKTKTVLRATLARATSSFS